ncbi:MAG: ISKra4 family transposase [Acidobacteria bacterium]|nr:ISKra4 family transposase [Acidobacteriota bacterium]
MAFPALLRDCRGAGARKMAHDALDKLLDDLEAEGEHAPTLRALSERLMISRQHLLATCLETALKQRYAAELTQKAWTCACGRTLRSWRSDPKELSTLHGRIILYRPYFYCRSCGTGCHPLDEQLQLAAATHQFDIQERSTRLGAEIPFGLSEEQFQRLTGVQASAHFIHGTLNAVGEAARLERVVPPADEIGRRIEDARAGSHRRPVLVVACDGAHAPTRPAGGRKKKRGPGAWREAKGVRLYLLGRDHRIIHVASWHEIGDKEHVSTALGIIASRIPRDQVRLALVADGAEWTWDVMRRHFPDGEEILDYYHCAEHVHATAHAQFGEGTLEAHEWTEAVLTRLALNELGRTLGGLKRMRPRSPAAAEEIRTLAVYLAGQSERFGYDELRRRGLPRGSGGIESANKLICHVRLKRSGAWWLEGNGNAMLRIRCAIYNGTFPQVFADYTAAKTVTPPDNK